MSISWLRVSGLMIVSAWLAAGCGGAKGLGQATGIDVGGPCVLSSDCNQPLVCTMERCHAECHTSLDCPDRQSCITANDQAKVCQLPSETRLIGPDSGVSGSGGVSGAGGAVDTGGSISAVPDASADRTADLAGDRGGVVERLDTAVPLGGLTMSQATLNFGSVDQGETVTKTITVTNTGLPVVVSPRVTGAGYIVQSTMCTTVALATNGSCAITVAFSPGMDASGGVSGTLTVGAGTTVSLSATVMVLGTFSASLSVLPATALVNQAVPVLVIVTATGPLSDLSCLSSGPDLTVDPAATTCMEIMAADVPCVYAFIFKASKAGMAMDQISCSSNGKVQTLAVSLNVLSPARLTISPTQVAFPTVVGATSDAVTFTIRNNGTASSGAIIVALGGTGAPQFIITDNQCRGVLAGGATCTIALVYKPTGASSAAASLTVTDATVGSTPATATLNGIGSPTIEQPSIIGAADLGSVTVGQAGIPAIYTITNNGGTASDLLTIGATDTQFAIGNDLCSGLALAGGKSCTFTVMFIPATVGSKTAVLTVRSGVTVAAQKPIQATGVPAENYPVLNMAPPTLNFGTIMVGTTAGPQTFTVTNNGGAATGVLAVTKSDSSVGGASQFTYSSACAVALSPGATCFLAVTFAPTTVGSASAIFTVADGTVSTPLGTVSGAALAVPGH